MQRDPSDDVDAGWRRWPACLSTAAVAEIGATVRGLHDGPAAAPDPSLAADLARLAATPD